MNAFSHTHPLNDPNTVWAHHCDGCNRDFTLAQLPSRAGAPVVAEQELRLRECPVCHRAIARGPVPVQAP